MAQVRVKELQQGYAKAQDHSSCSGAAPKNCPCYQELEQILGCGEAQTPLYVVESELPHHIVDRPLREEDKAGEAGELHQEEEEEAAGTLSQEPVLQTPEASQASMDIGAGTSARLSTQQGSTTPTPPPSWSRGTHRHWQVYMDLLEEHVVALQDLNWTLQQRTEEETKWCTRLLDELVQQHTSICATMREVLCLPAPVTGTTPSVCQAPAPLAPPTPKPNDCPPSCPG